MTAPNSPLFKSNSFMALANLDQAAMAFPEAVYLYAADGRVLRFNQKAVELRGRTPTVGERQERLCDSFRLYRMDGTLLHQDQCAMALALQTGGSLREQEFVIEEPGGLRPVGCRHICCKKEFVECVGSTFTSKTAK
jgi:PAS domain-containing protein